MVAARSGHSLTLGALPSLARELSQLREEQQAHHTEGSDREALLSDRSVDSSISPVSPCGLLHSVPLCPPVQVGRRGGRAALELETRRWPPPGGRLAPAVAERLLRLLAGHAHGGALVVHAPTEELERVVGEPTDDGYLSRRLRRDDISHVVRHDAGFAQVLEEFTEHAEGDRWPPEHPDIDARGQPKDGGFAVSATGSLRAAAVKFYTEPGKTPFLWPGKGMRHTAALALAYSIKHCAVYVMSESHSLHVITADSAKRGRVYEIGDFDIDLWRCTPTSLRPPCSCELCGMPFRATIQLYAHMAKCHPDLSPSPGPAIASAAAVGEATIVDHSASESTFCGSSCDDAASDFNTACGRLGVPRPDVAMADCQDVAMTDFHAAAGQPHTRPQESCCSIS